MAHELKIRAHAQRGDDRRPDRLIAGFDVDVILDGRPLEWVEVELVLKPNDAVTVRLTLPLNKLTVDTDVLVVLRAMADAKTKVVDDGEGN
ncbi:hypothetical protein LCGC14_2489650 [marine sediment metagenome]|uniref:Uncharacterized protein n=1 Tax=marine sediment metagenome TaxID=412755 RepID=A0A0F9DGZ2_9ZZZZ